MNLIEVSPREKFCLFLRYDDGAQGVVDLSALAGRGVFAQWLQTGSFEAVKLSERGVPQWSGEIDVCPVALDMKLTGKRPEDVFSALKNLPTHA